MAMDQQYTDTLKELEQAKAARDEYRNHLEVICEMTGEGSDIGAAHEAVNALIEQRDQYRAAEEAQIALRAKMEQERDALAAHLEQLSYLIVDAKRCAAVLAFPLNYNAPDYQSFAKDVMSTIEALSKKEPIASLACRDLIQRAEELEEFAAELPKFSAMGMEKALILKARERRKQAEGHQ
ncbi:hypothetical protein HZU72_17490 [Halomonas sp. QX-2]|uniref:Uncharacterized protein n=1 Tax=Vreelandella sedimenti TaxID=2729618 RepID=A0A7Z0N9N5_9GAMM|nr:hypothetical protein [Halomonas sedimenti]NYT74207.1 hypothetical protein [Halomonas sedimenti]